MGELPLGGLICRIGEPGAVVGVVAPRVGGLGSRAASEFSFGLGRQAIVPALLYG
jgi:hypothetical protein